MVVKQKKKENKKKIEEEEEEEEEERRRIHHLLALLLIILLWFILQLQKNISICCLFRRKSHSEPLVNQVIAFAAQEEAEVGRWHTYTYIIQEIFLSLPAELGPSTNNPYLLSMKEITLPETRFGGANAILSGL